MNNKQFDIILPRARSDPSLPAGVRGDPQGKFALRIDPPGLTRSRGQPPEAGQKLLQPSGRFRSLALRTDCFVVPPRNDGERNVIANAVKQSVDN